MSRTAVFLLSLPGMSKYDKETGRFELFQAKCRPWLVKAAGCAPPSATVTSKPAPLIATKLRIVNVGKSFNR